MAGAWLEVFRSGTHTSGNGIEKTYTDEDIKQIAQTYNDQKEHEAPLVLGHPATDDPAYGWAKELKEAGGKLLAYVDHVSDGIKEAVSRGEYKKVSIALYPDGLLRHIGLLGAVPPAVKGLAPVQFAEGQEFEEYTVANDEAQTIATKILTGLQKFFSDIIAGQKPASSFSENQAQEEKDMDELKQQIADLSAALASRTVAHDTQFAAMASTIDTLTQKLDAGARTSGIEASKSAFAVFAEGLAKEGKILPAEKDGIIEEYADLLAAEGTLTFAEGQVKPSEKMKARLTARPVLIQPGKTFAEGDQAAPRKLDATEVPAQFAELANRVNPESLDIDRQIREYAETNKCTYEAAASAYAAA